MKLEKIKTIASIIAFAVIIIVGLFFSRGRKEVLADFLAESYKCIVIEKPLEKNINARSFIYPCIDYNNRTKEVNINSQLFHKTIMVGDTIEKKQGDSIVIVKRKQYVLRFALSLSYDSNVDTLTVR